MASNPNESLTNRHALAIGKSGSGKTYWLKRHPDVRRAAGRRLLVWDPYQSHDCHYQEDKRAFARHVANAVKQGRGFRLGLSMQPSQDNFEFFCQCAWIALDGAKQTTVLIEEANDVTQPGKARAHWGQLIRVGRKFGAVIMVATQRPQEIDKTIFTQTDSQWVGLVSGYDRAYVEKYLDLERGLLNSIEPNSYRYVMKRGADIVWGGPKQPKY